MRTTLDLNDALLRRAKAEAARKGTTLTRLIEEGLALRLEQPASPRPKSRRPFRVRVFDGREGLYPDIDPMNSSALLAESEHEWALRQAGMLPFRDPDA